MLYEGESVQNYEYYFGDDEIDDRESMREENLYSDVETLTNYDDISDESYEEYYSDEEDNEPTPEELKEWIGSNDEFA